MSVDTSHQLEDDALASQFNLIIHDIPGGGRTKRISLRMDQTFEPPEELINTIDVWFRGLKIPKTHPSEGTTKEFNVSVRMDADWHIYDDLKKWMRKCYDPRNSTALANSSTTTNIWIEALNRTGKNVKTFKFIDAKIKSLKVDPFDNASDDPIRLTLSFIYRRMDDDTSNF